MVLFPEHRSVKHFSSIVVAPTLIMKTRATTALLVGVGAVAATVLLPLGAHAQPGSDGGDGMVGGPPDSAGGGGPPDSAGGGGPPGMGSSSVEVVECPEDGSNAHYDEFLR